MLVTLEPSLQPQVALFVLSKRFWPGTECFSSGFEVLGQRGWSLGAQTGVWGHRPGWCQGIDLAWAPVAMGTQFSSLKDDGAVS